jgi:hypothetical protein
MFAELSRLDEARKGSAPWKKWGPYLSERQWGTVREDYSENGDAWNYFPHDHARSRAYHWGEDGLAGISDDRQGLCFALALWNGNDPILKERLFGLSNSEGNHGEDVKEYYFYLDSTPTHSYMKYLYKYPQAAFPYHDLVRTNQDRGRGQPEYELLDTGVFDQDRYFDVFVEYAKASPEDMLIQITVHNRGPEETTLQLLPTLWFRNDWAWGDDVTRPALRQVAQDKAGGIVALSHRELGERFFYAAEASDLLFTDNETNEQRLRGAPNPSPYVKDGIGNFIVHGDQETVNPEKAGTKVAAHYPLTLGAGESRTVRLRLSNQSLEDPKKAIGKLCGKAFDSILKKRLQEADEFYASIIPSSFDSDQSNVMRQALAGMLWSKQYFFYDVGRWLKDHGIQPYNANQRSIRNDRWGHMINMDVISMPDKWEYPWYAAWDLAFHVTILTMVDADFGKEQLELLLKSRYIHPNGQLPAYEWNFGDVNPPVHAWSTIYTYRLEEALRGQGDLAWLERSYHKLLLNFNWWVNRKDRAGNNAFEGGFLGLDNIGVFDRSAPLPTGGYLEQADGTAWMAFFSQNMLSIAMEIARHDPTYEDMVLKFVQHFLWIAGAMDRIGDNQDELWDETDGFFYDVLVLPDGSAQRIKVRSMVGLLPLTAAAVIESEMVSAMPKIVERVRAFIEKRPELVANIHSISQPGVNGRRLLSVLNEDKLRRILAHMLDEDQFLSEYGIRSLSRWHQEHPLSIIVHGQQYTVQYLPAESNTGLFGGNSNWRGPIWFPVNALIIRALLVYYRYYGDDYKVECPTGSGHMMTLYEVAREIGLRLASIFERNEQGLRPVFGGAEKFQNDPYWRDHILFYEYFHGDNGAGLGANHQTGWTGLVSVAYKLFGSLAPERYLQSGPLMRLIKDDTPSQQ